MRRKSERDEENDYILVSPHHRMFFLSIWHQEKVKHRKKKNGKWMTTFWSLEWICDDRKVGLRETLYSRNSSFSFYDTITSSFECFIAFLKHWSPINLIVGRMENKKSRKNFSVERLWILYLLWLPVLGRV